MKIAVTARGPGPDFSVDENFGRCYWLMLIDSENGAYDALDNRDIRNVSKGAGEKLSEWLQELNVKVVITGKIGPKAKRRLDKHQIKAFHGATGSVAEAFDQWQDGRLNLAEEANCEGSPFCLVSNEHVGQVRNENIKLRLVETH